MAELIFEDITVEEDIPILYLEDEPFYQKEMKKSLKNLGFTGDIIFAGTLSEAIETAQKRKFQLMLTDWNLPDGVGIDFLESVRKTPQYDQTPVIMVTTMDEVNDILDAVNKGADGYIVKPWKEEELVEKIAFALKKRK